MKLSISLPDNQVELLDRIVVTRGLSSRSAAIQKGIDLLFNDALVSEYRLAFAEWEASGEPQAWNSVVSDGLDENDTTWW